MLDLNYISNMLLGYVKTNSLYDNYNNIAIQNLIYHDPSYITQSVNYSMLGYFGDINKLNAIMLTVTNNILPNNIDRDIKLYLYQNTEYIIDINTYRTLINNTTDIMYITSDDISKIFADIEEAVYRDVGTLMSHLTEYLISIHPDIVNMVLSDFYFDESDIKMYIKDRLSFVGVYNDVFLIDFIDLTAIIHEIFAKPEDYIDQSKILNIIDNEIMLTYKKCGKDIYSNSYTYNSKEITVISNKVTPIIYEHIAVLLCQLFESVVEAIMLGDTLKLKLQELDQYAAYINTIKILTSNLYTKSGVGNYVS